jgi:hypothetical protein
MNKLNCTQKPEELSRNQLFSTLENKRELIKTSDGLITFNNGRMVPQMYSTQMKSLLYRQSRQAGP